MSFLQTHLQVSATITNAFRLGKKSTKPCLLKISLNNLEEKIVILKNKTKLRPTANPENIRKLYITPDLTPLEQKENKALRQQLAELNKTERLYVIKNGKVVWRTT